ncbi:MAG TPA: type IV secretory system conjugative DNA transfer family protein [Candidatus Binataceae bacterium]|nr:type IV secretory system conjugative DNA transfer family protein [Candidatus Binataceae bacterium]
MPGSLWETDGGIYFGHRILPDRAAHDRSLLDEQWQVVRDKFHHYTDDRHLVTVGPNGSGKTRRLLIPNLVFLKNWSILVVDPKGTLAALTGPYREAQHPNSVMVIDPFRVLESDYPALVKRYPFLKSAGFNPVAALDPESDDFPDDARGLAEAIIHIEDGDHPHWERSAQDLVSGLMMCDRIENGAKSSMVAVREWVGAEAETLARQIKEKFIPLAQGRHHAIPAKLNRFTKISGENRELFSILSTAQTQTGWLDSLPIQFDLSKGVTDFGRMKDAPTTVYLILPPRYLATHSTWLRLMVTSVLQPLMRSVRPAAVPVLFMLDEFAQLGHLAVIENNLALMREYGVKLWPVFQDLAQAQAIYKARWESFISNAGVVQTFAPQDVTTRKYLSEISGQRLYWLETTSRSMSATSGPSLAKTSGAQEGWQNMQGPVYWPQGLAAMEDGQAILFARGRAPRAWLPDPSAIPQVQAILARAAHEMGR